MTAFTSLILMPGICMNCVRGIIQYAGADPGPGKGRGTNGQVTCR